MAPLNGQVITAGLALEHKLPPQNLEVERGVLGIAMLDGSTMEEISRRVTADDFYRDTHQTIYRALLDLWAQGKPTNAPVLADELIRVGEFERVGGDETLRHLAEQAPVAANAAYYAAIVREKAMARALALASNETIREVYSNRFTAAELVNAAQARMMAITEGRGIQRVATLDESLTEVVNLIHLRQGGAVTGLGSGYADVDAITAGFQPGSLNVLAARPSMGKSALGANIAEYVAVRLARPVLFVSLEMTRDQLVQRMLCGRSGISGYKLSTGLPRLNLREWERLDTARRELSTPLLTFDDTPALGALEIMASARSLHRKNPLGLIVVDYLQIVSAEDESRSRQEQVSKISARLKSLARELGTAVLALSQLNRAVENREDRKPRMADVRESGAIEQDADTVMLLHRPEYYDPNDQPGIAEVIVAKNRHGAIGTAKLVFRKDQIRFESEARQNEIDPGNF